MKKNTNISSRSQYLNKKLKRKAKEKRKELEEHVKKIKPEGIKNLLSRKHFQQYVPGSLSSFPHI